MPRKIEKNAKSKEEALRLAAEEFGVAVEELSYTVEREIGKGFLGRILGREVIISAWVTKEAEDEERLRKGREQRRQAREEKALKSQQKIDASKLNKSDKKTAGSAVIAPEKSKTVKPAKNDAVSKRQAVSKSKDIEDVKSATVDTELQRKDNKRREVTEKSITDAKYFAEQLIHKMGLEEAEILAVNAGTSVDVTVSGERMGLLIGKRGDTLDAVQYLTSLYVNKEKNSYVKINIDTEGYRAKREETLVKLAHGLERRVLRDGKPVTLEPMSPNERRIIHAALQNSNKICTGSIGEEPNRKVVVSLKN